MHTLPTVSLAAELAALEPVNTGLEPAARAHLDNLTKPVGSLGRLEDLATRLYCIQDGRTPLAAAPARMITIAGDHGVVAQGIALTPQAVTVQMVLNFLNNGAGINVLCRAADVDFQVVDAGVLSDFEPHERLVRAKIGRGTADLSQGPAMSRDDCLRALELGIALAEMAHADGMRVVGMGEMGIGNTTPSSALFCAYLGISPAEAVGMGAGIPPKGLAHKTEIIAQGLRANAEAVQSGDPVAVLAALGGYEIAALAGLVIGAARRKLAVMVDGFIATAACTAAARIAPAVTGYCFFSHGSAEAGHVRALKRLGQKPLLDLGLRLGEGTGAALGIFLLKSAAAIFNEMATFESAGVKV